jgi:integrase
MSARVTLQARVGQYLAERRRLGFELDTMGHALARFARYVTEVGHRGSLTVDLMAGWARQAKAGHGTRATSARRLRLLRPFTRWLRQFEPATEVPDEAIFGPIPGRVAPHIYRENEIVQLLRTASRVGPPGGLRGAVMQMLFGLMACAGLRISEALALCDADVDLKSGVLTIRQSKFGKSRLVPLHPSAVQALAHYRVQRACHVPTTPETPFFTATRGRLLGQPVSDRQAHRIFDQLRKQLRWVNRGGHGAPRIHDLRHSFAVRRLLLWHEQGVDISQRMLALSTYLGHAKVSNTYWYLSGVPELMGLAGKRFEHFADPWADGDE